MARPRIVVKRLGKSYGQVDALVDVSLAVGAGSVLGVLGHNGAGKTTLVDVLATRTPPSTGSARVCGWDVVRSGHRVRQHIGMTSQFAAVDDAMSGWDNLVLIGRLLGATKRQARERADALISSFDLRDAATRKAVTYSGGMRRRLDLAASMVAQPEVLFLDEPTTGLDPVSRTDVWELVENLVARGTTVVLTTQYIEEAERLADRVVLLAAGRVVASGTPERLKATVGKRTATVDLGSPAAVHRAAALLRRYRLSPGPIGPRSELSVPIRSPGDIPMVLRILDADGIAVRDLTVTEPTLHDVYLALHRAGWTTR
ncbi:ATP-binding cassette domain-containing protein [Amycolatopsis sp. CA-126428]|uniref:ATP-binding cassette domain-containing protein n=1 Tax=Amycolatopsis sp. CA-126428 TaxID=2073158 RepID=UPI000CD14209|nr:ATP-binding cassette domain-containing protein [Amycolatopsis sp. CA-126428]